MKIKSLNHSTYKLQYHLVWGTKYRRKFLKPYVKLELIKLLEQITKKYPTIEIENINTDDDHVHMQVVIAPSVAISDAVRKMKGVTSKELRNKFKFIRKMYIGKEGIWSVGYFVSSVGINEEQVKRYIERQDKKDKPQTTRLFDGLA
jgi:putative transposase